MPFTFTYLIVSVSFGMSIHILPIFLKRKSMIKETLLDKVKKNASSESDKGHTNQTVKNGKIKTGKLGGSNSSVLCHSESLDSASSSIWLAMLSSGFFLAGLKCFAVEPVGLGGG